MSKHVRKPPTYTKAIKQRAIINGALGALAGGYIGHLRGMPLRGTVLGGLTGAASGGAAEGINVIGDVLQKKHKKNNISTRALAGAAAGALATAGLLQGLSLAAKVPLPAKAFKKPVLQAAALEGLVRGLGGAHKYDSKSNKKHAAFSGGVTMAAYQLGLGS